MGDKMIIAINKTEEYSRIVAIEKFLRITLLFPKNH